MTAGGGCAQKNVQTENQRPQSTFFTFTEIHMAKRSGKTSATSAVAGFAGVIDDAILRPAGVKLRSDKEHLIWNHFTRAPKKIGVTCTLFCWQKS